MSAQETKAVQVIKTQIAAVVKQIEADKWNIRLHMQLAELEQKLEDHTSTRW